MVGIRPHQGKMANIKWWMHLHRPRQCEYQTHIHMDDTMYWAATHADGWDIRHRCQPPNSRTIGRNLFFYEIVNILSKIK